jgi:phosphate transport system protein
MSNSGKVGAMREDYQLQLESINIDLVAMTELVGKAMSKATTSLLNDDLKLAEEVIAGDELINSLNSSIEERSLQMVALQAPVARDLRILMSAIRMGSSLERMGDLASHIAKQVRLRYPNPSIPAELHETFSRMGDAATKIVAETGRVIKTRDADLAEKIKVYDDELDNLHRELFSVVLSDDWAHGVESAIDVTLLSRFYERFGDHAVTVARRVVHIVTGEPYTK